VTTIDRYRSFKGIDFDGQASRMVARIETHTQGTDDPFWAYFFKRRNATQGMRCDDQLLLSSFVNQIRELLEARGDDEGLAWLDQLEAECF
jgi:N(2)-fixation sustaining protein CowN